MYYMGDGQGHVRVCTSGNIPLQDNRAMQANPREGRETILDGLC